MSSIEAGEGKNTAPFGFKSCLTRSPQEKKRRRILEDLRPYLPDQGAHVLERLHTKKRWTGPNEYKLPHVPPTEMREGVIPMTTR